jgi:hypothetical protein
MQATESHEPTLTSPYPQFACSGIVLCCGFVLVNRPSALLEIALGCLKRPSAIPAVGVRRAAMAKGQVKSNKEIRKPKAEKPKPAVSVGTSPFTQVPGKK